MTNIIKKEEAYLVNPIKITVSPLNLNFLENDATFKSNVFDAEFESGLKKADKLDYCFAMFSGTVAFVLNQYLLKFHEDNIDFENLDKQKTLQFLVKFYKQNEILNKEYQKEIQIYAKKAENLLFKAEDYKNLAVDFKKSLDYKGLITAIIEELLNIQIGLDDNGAFCIRPVNFSDALSVKDKLVKAVFSWIVDQAYIYKTNEKYKKEFGDASLKSQLNNLGFNNVVKIIKELSESVFFKQKDFSPDTLKRFFVEQLEKNKNKLKQSEDVEMFQSHDISVRLNKVMIIAYAYVRFFIRQVKEHNIRTLEGLKIVHFGDLYEEDERVILRLESVSSGIYLALDCVVSMCMIAKGDEGFKKAAARINISNVCQFVIVLNQEYGYIKKDIEELLNKSKVVEIKRYETVCPDDLRECLELNRVEQRILYSLELHMIEEDIQHTKDSSDQIKKNNWKMEWIKLTEESLQMAKVFEENPQKIYQALNIHASNRQNLIWLYCIAIELMLFKPYYSLESGNKEYKDLKYTDGKYMQNIFCSAQSYINYSQIEELKKIYIKYSNSLRNMQVKSALYAGGAVALMAVGGGLAFAFAPEIAVLLFGGGFPALHGAALISASLAAAGGGALAVGGAGMAGGTILLAGGGALIGLGTGAVLSKTTFALTATPEYVCMDYSKLLTKCNLVLIKKYHLYDEVYTVQQLLQNNIEEVQLKVDVLKTQEEKKYISIIKNLNKSLAYMKKSNQELGKLLD